MFNKYADLILLLLILVEFLRIYSNIRLSQKNKNLKEEKQILLDAVLNSSKNNSTLKTESSRILHIMLSNAERIQRLEERHEQVDHIMSHVLHISNIIGPGEKRIDGLIIIEELRQRAKFAEELEKCQIDPQEFYQGD
jgi:spore cortex formation protein SpoVR/YcgB (stage V sporulation)